MEDGRATSAATTRFRPWCPTQTNVDEKTTMTMSMGMTMVPVMEMILPCAFTMLNWFKSERKRERKKNERGRVIWDWLPDLLCCLGNLGTLQCRIGWTASAGSVSCWAQLRGCWAARALAPLSVPSRQRSTHDGPASELWWRASCVPRMASMEREERSSTGGNERLVFTNRARPAAAKRNISLRAKMPSDLPFRWRLNCTCKFEGFSQRKLAYSRSDW